MTTKRNGTAAKMQKNSRVKSDNVSLSGVNVSAPVGVGVTSSSSPAVGVGASGAAAPGKVRNNFTSSFDNSVKMENEDIKVIELRTKIASKWTAPKFENSTDYAAVAAAVASLPQDLKERAINGARLAWLARPENAALTPTINEVIEEINTNYAKEFAAVCGCSCPAASAARLFSFTSLSVTTINADSNINDYVYSASIPSGLSASGLVGALMTVRHLVSIKRAIAAAVAAARCDLFNAAENVARRALRLGVTADVLTRYMSLKMQAVSINDNKDINRLRRNLVGCSASLAALDHSIMYRCVGVTDIDTSGDFFISTSATLPASASAKVRKLWAKRVKVLSSIATIRGLIKRG